MFILFLFIPLTVAVMGIGGIVDQNRCQEVAEANHVAHVYTFVDGCQVPNGRKGLIPINEYIRLRELKGGLK